jgi:hypothetical protein
MAGPAVGADRMVGIGCSRLATGERVGVGGWSGNGYINWQRCGNQPRRRWK